MFTYVFSHTRDRASTQEKVVLVIHGSSSLLLAFTGCGKANRDMRSRPGPRRCEQFSRKMSVPASEQVGQEIPFFLDPGRPETLGQSGPGSSSRACHRSRRLGPGWPRSSSSSGCRPARAACSPRPPPEGSGRLRGSRGLWISKASVQASCIVVVDLRDQEVLHALGFQGRISFCADRLACRCHEAHFKLLPYTLHSATTTK